MLWLLSGLAATSKTALIEEVAVAEVVLVWFCLLAVAARSD